ncbi:MAG: hypothetical protein SNI72_05725 [Rikenellaceae bacterium]
MAKTLVCIVEEEMILNYLFVKELFERGDGVLLISQQRYAPIVKRFASLFPSVKVDSIILAKDGDEDLWDTICRTIRAGVSAERRYAVNLSSGTRLMSIAVQQVFERCDSQFYFMPIDRNVIIHSQIDDNNDNNDDEIIEIKHRVTIDEYLKINDIRCTRQATTQPKVFTSHFIEVFTQNLLSSRDYGVIESLRGTKGRRVGYEQIEGLESFIKYIGFTPSHDGGLTDGEVKYLTGGGSRSISSMR